MSSMPECRKCGLYVHSGPCMCGNCLDAIGKNIDQGIKDGKARAAQTLGITADTLFARIRESLDRGLVDEARAELNFVDGLLARESKLEAALRDGGLALDIAEKGRHDASVIRDARLEAITGYRARLLAKIEAKETT